MPDIALRFHKDALVLSSPAADGLRRLGVDPAQDGDFTLLFEPEIYEELYRLETAAEPQCLTAPTAYLTPIRLAQASMEQSAQELAVTALRLVQNYRPQHTLVELIPCGLPLDTSSAASLKETRSQYQRFAQLFAQETFDGYLLRGFTSLADLRCALEALREADERPVLASVAVDAEGNLLGSSYHKESLEEACELMSAGAAVVGFETAAAQDQACALARRARRATDKPLLVSLEVAKRDGRQGGPTPENPYYCADMMVATADALWTYGVQFYRAEGDVTPAYTGALVAATMGRDVCAHPAM